MSFSRHGIQHDYKDTISGVHVHVCPGSAETLVRRGGITSHRLMAYSFNNICVKNYQNRLMCVEVIVCNISVVFKTQCRIININNSNDRKVHRLSVLYYNSTTQFKCQIKQEHPPLPSIYSTSRHHVKSLFRISCLSVITYNDKL